MQSKVTARVQALEEEIGVALFERHSRGVTLTAAGKRLLPFAERLASITKEAILAARDDGVPKGPLAIDSMETTAAARLPPMLAGFHQDYPLVDLSLQTAPTAALVQSVLDGRLDGAFVAGPIEHPDLVATRAFSEELVLITASRWKSFSALQQAKRATGLTIPVFRTGCTYRQKLEQILNEMGWPCGSRLEMGTLVGIIGCVAADHHRESPPYCRPQREAHPSLRWGAPATVMLVRRPAAGGRVLQASTWWRGPAPRGIRPCKRLARS